MFIHSLGGIAGWCVVRSVESTASLRLWVPKSRKDVRHKRCLPRATVLVRGRQWVLGRYEYVTVLRTPYE